MIDRDILDRRLRELARDLPAMLNDLDTFPARFEERAMRILSETAPADEAYLMSVLDALAERSRYNASRLAGVARLS